MPPEWSCSSMTQICCFLDAKKQHILNQIDVLKIFKTSTNKHFFDSVYVVFLASEKQQICVLTRTWSFLRYNLFYPTHIMKGIALIST